MPHGRSTALAAQPGCLAAAIGQSTDDPDLIVVRTEWAGVGAYRRALSAFDVKVNAVPLLSAAIDEPSAYELVRHWTPAASRSRPAAWRPTREPWGSARRRPRRAAGHVVSDFANLADGGRRLGPGSCGGAGRRRIRCSWP